VVTAVISDLHLGTRTETDLLRRPRLRETLIGALECVDHVVLLGDSIELRDGPPSRALEIATPFFEDLGEALAGRQVTVVAGNHDHQLASAWLERRRRETPLPLGLEQFSVPPLGGLLARLARRMSDTEVVLAYPGLWLRPDVYATHGHYLDCHNRVATFECIARRATELVLREPRGGYRAPDDYEAVLTPLYRAIYRVAQSRRARPAARSGKALVRRWERIAGYRGPRRRPGLAAMVQVVETLRIEARHVIFGHLHRPGPLEQPAPAWTTAGGVRLVNTGAWVHEPGHLPGTCVFLGSEGPPQIKHVLGGLNSDDLGTQIE
jgi:predicted phosphodiesterase